LHVVERKVTLPLPPICEKVIVSPVTGGWKPLTVAVHVDEAPVPMLFGTQLTVVVVGFLVLQVTPWLPELPVWSKSPP
jgi:hypothetical protein